MQALVASFSRQKDQPVFIEKSKV
uniref:Uncharacterized protein n=1 Tax=Arundo donax TaxID=35708 RepID=A0A0A9HV13_ARUDO